MSDPNAVHEANLLLLDISKAKFRLGWEPRTNIDQCVALVADWYKRYRSEDAYQLCIEEIEKYVRK
jgi:CDP-glucose 4,6-dehydratase